ncbi:restriction endonuclease subunit S [Algoriphagus sp. AK58]|uniref:restriction endonuclease subunit S n=1 Tax=Algoriphagus sp. AK58 TaxID=1406877 RepID=UPI00164FBCB5|nr:restriction endonuclease subunit S [Algoriphagus sp. AK58]
MSDRMIDSVENKPKLIPELRFPEFEMDGEWEEKPLISIANKNVKWSFTGGPFGSNLKASDYMSSGIRILQLQNIGDGEFLDEYKIYTSLEKADELLSCNIYAGDIILSKMGDPVGRACIIPDHLERCVMASDGIRFVVNEIKYSKYFIYSLLNSKQIRKVIEKKSTGSTRKRIGLNELKEVQLPLPRNLQEQQKIASCLSSLDELITANRAKLEALQAHKKGLMQNLFPQEGQTVPNFRFPEFEDDGEWEEKKLREIATLLSGGTPSKSEESYWNGTIPWISASSMHKLEIWDSELKITEHAINAGTRLVEEGTILILVRGSMLFNKVPICVTMKPVSFNQDVKALILKQHYDKQFILYNLLAHENNIPIDKTGIGAGKIGSEELKGLTLFIPKSEKEQQKIAACLSEVDKLITAQTEKIDRLLQHKKGLIQGLFPKNLD